MRRIIMLFQAAAIVAVVMAMSAAPAMAQITFPRPTAFNIQEGPVSLGGANDPGIQEFALTAGNVSLGGVNKPGTQAATFSAGGVSLNANNHSGISLKY